MKIHEMKWEKDWQNVVAQLLCKVSIDYSVKTKTLIAFIVSILIITIEEEEIPEEELERLFLTFKENFIKIRNTRKLLADKEGQ